MFYFVVCNFGKGNDNKVGNFIVEADSRSEAIRLLIRYGMFGKYDRTDVHYDESRVMFQWYYNGTKQSSSADPDAVGHYENYSILSGHELISEAQNHLIEYRIRFHDILKG